MAACKYTLKHSNKSERSNASAALRSLPLSSAPLKDAVSEPPYFPPKHVYHTNVSVRLKDGGEVSRLMCAYPAAVLWRRAVSGIHLSQEPTTRRRREPHAIPA